MLEMLCYTFRRKLSSSASLLACAMAEDAVSSASDPPPIIMEGSSDNCSGIPKEANGAICSVSDPPVVVEGSFCKYSGLSAQLVKEATSFKNVSVQAARELLNRGFQYLDVRTPKEYAAGHVEGKTKNLKFIDEVSEHFKKTDEIVVACQSGKRSSLASADLFDLGFTEVANMEGGFSAWFQNAFPIVK
ncbi:hypothetical protein O6H91_12G045600 [Diphasiastrum complanatum]|uniref:Uncharacterized protein n=1 Tax=Diphasiastrum complanatum TaxID=34168 RepID=A0ACC2C183_DIPCM|nr:hypothetical protein O6H91_12G045600 [Diphasiastrum complanatum]